MKSHMKPKLLKYGWYPARSVLHHGEKMSLKPWLVILLVMVSQKNTLWGKNLITSISLEPHIFLMGWLQLNLNH